MTTSLCLPDSHTPVPDGSTYARTHKVHMHACTGPSCLPDPRTPVPMPVPAGSTHARVHAQWIHTHTHALGPCTHTRLHRVPMRARLQDLHVCSFAGSPHPLTRRVPTCTRSRGPHARMHWAHTCTSHRVPMGAHSQGPHVCLLAGSLTSLCLWHQRSLARTRRHG